MGLSKRREDTRDIAAAESGAKKRGNQAGLGAENYTAYSTYKSSGVEGIGEVPVHWESVAIARVTQSRCDGPFGSGLKSQHYSEDGVRVIRLQNIGGPNFVNADKAFIDETHASSLGDHSVFQGDLLIAGLGDETHPVGRACVAPSGLGRAMVKADCFRFRLVQTRALSQFLAYQLSATAIAASACFGTGSTRSRVNLSTMSARKIALPPITEQRSIATFLDRETAKIDALAAKKERLIELLEEKRIGLIIRAVTRGLDPDVPMKDSGVEWLGEIPVHWRIKKLKRWASLVQTGSTPPTSNPLYFEEGTVPWHGPSSFSSDLLLRPATRKVAEGAVRDRVVRIFDEGSTMIVTIGATIGRVGFINEPSSCNQQITAITFNSENVFARYAGYQMKRFEPILAGIAPSTTLPILDRGQIGHLPFFGPPMSEQRAIAAHLDRETAKIDALVAKVREAIDRLKELRTALISAAVTGKIDVREIAA